MSKNIAAMLRLHLMDTRYSFAVFWSILIGFFAVSCILVSVFEGSTVIMSSWFAIYVYALIGGAVTVQGTFPLALGWSVPRKDYYLATMIHYVVACLALSATYMIMYGIEKWLGSLLFADQIQFFSIPFYRDEQPVWFLFWLHFIVSLMLLSVGHFFGSLYYRYGWLGIFVLMGLTVLLAVLINLLDAWDVFYRLLDQIDSMAELTLWMIPFVIVCFAVAWLFLRKAPAKKAG